jgi:hypothetical protein
MRALLTIVMCVLWATVGPAQTRVTVYLYCGLPAEGFVPEDACRRAEGPVAHRECYACRTGAARGARRVT